MRDSVVNVLALEFPLRSDDGFASTYFFTENDSTMDEINHLYESALLTTFTLAILSPTRSPQSRTLSCCPHTPTSSFRQQTGATCAIHWSVCYVL